MSETKYKHRENLHNLEASTDMVKLLYNLFKPTSLLDVGCGVGNFLYSFKELGVKEILGIDGFWVDKEKISLYLDKSEFIEHNLEMPISLSKTYDLILCLEVGEHLKADAAKILVSNLVSFGKIIIFSAAIPEQGGQNHVNEQWQSYWTDLFEKENYSMKDIIRPYLWNEKQIPWWYRQNTFVYIHKDIPFDDPNCPPIINLVHPELYLAKVSLNVQKYQKINRIMEGKENVFFYLKLLLKSLVKKK